MSNINSIESRCENHTSGSSNYITVKPHNLDTVYNLIINDYDISSVSTDDPEILFYIGVAYELKSNYKMMWRYFNMAIERGYSNALVYIAYYYYHTHDNIKANKFLTDAINSENILALSLLKKLINDGTISIQ